MIFGLPGVIAEVSSQAHQLAKAGVARMHKMRDCRNPDALARAGETQPGAESKKKPRQALLGGADEGVRPYASRAQNPCLTWLSALTAAPG